eukprot:5318317-Prymnesium_polylepis.2
MVSKACANACANACAKARANAWARGRWGASRPPTSRVQSAALSPVEHDVCGGAADGDDRGEHVRRERPEDAKLEKVACTRSLRRGARTGGCGRAGMRGCAGGVRVRRAVRAGAGDVRVRRGVRACAVVCGRAG